MSISDEDFSLYLTPSCEVSTSSQPKEEESDDSLNLYLTPSQDYVGPSEVQGQPGDPEGQDEGDTQGQTPPDAETEDAQPYQCTYNFL